MLKFLEGDEKILMVARKHWFIMLGPVLGLIVIALLPAVVLFFVNKTVIFGQFISQLPTTINVTAILMSAYFAWLIILWIILAIQLTNYYLDKWIVTDRRILAINQAELFSRQFSVIPLEKTQDISTDTSGLIPTLLGFGTMQVETAGDNKVFILYSAMRVEKLKQIISDAVEAISHSKPGSSSV